MRQPRLLAPESSKTAYYHCVSRVVDRQRVFGDEEKEEFVRLMRLYAEFCDVRMITYCVLSNHFHVLVEVPCKEEGEPSCVGPGAVEGGNPQIGKSSESGRGNVGCVGGAGMSDEAFLRWLKPVYEGVGYETIKQRLEWFREAGHHQAAEELRWQYLRRRRDLSEFMKALKQRFTQWFNRRKGRKGTLWEERFRSVLVEGCGRTLSTMAAYIDLNPVRAGLVDDPMEYRWCGYAAAEAGRKDARRGLTVAVEALAAEDGRAEAKTMREVLEQYREALGLWGIEREDAEGRVRRRGMRPETLAKIAESGGKLTLAEMLRVRVRYFADGWVIGSRAFVDAIFADQRERFGAKRKDGARRWRGVEAEAGLFSLRDLRKQVWGKAGR